MVKCRNGRALAAHIVPQKGAGVEWITMQVMRDLAKFGLQGCMSMIIKSDQESAIVDVARAVTKQRGKELGPEARTHLEHAPKGESSSNGYIGAGAKRRRLSEESVVLSSSLRWRRGQQQWGQWQQLR